MIKNICFIYTCLMIVGTVQSQTIEIVKDLRPGFQSGYLNDNCVYKGELYFAGQDADPAFHEVFSIGDEGIIRKRSMAPDVRGAEIIHCTNQFTYIYNREAPFVRDLYRYSANSLVKIHSFNNQIVQSFEFENGVVFVEEDDEQNKKVFYFDDNSNTALAIIDSINLGQYELDITQSNDYLTISPLNDKYYDEGVIIYNVLTKQIDMNLLAAECEFIRYAYGFDEHIIYSCDGEYFVINLGTLNKMSLELDGRYSFRSFANSSNVTESENYIFIRPQEERVLLSISKQSLSIEELSEKVGSIVNIINQEGLLYFVEIDAAGQFYLFESNGSFESRKEITFSEDKLSLRVGALLEGRPHFVVSQGSSFQNDYLVNVNDNHELVVLKELLYSIYDPLLERIGDKLIFAHSENETGIELYSLSYTNTSVEDIKYSNIDLYPNPSNGYIRIPILEEEIKNIHAVSTLGQEVPIEKIGNEVRIIGSGLFKIIIQTSNSIYSSSVFVNR